jgi:hypothetical protein
VTARQVRRLGVLDAVGQQAAWLTAVLSAAHGQPAWGVAAVAQLLIRHVATRSGQRATILVLACAAALGAVAIQWACALPLLAALAQALASAAGAAALASGCRGVEGR